MATIKSYTDISQAKILDEILSSKGADMCFKCFGEETYDLTFCEVSYSEWAKEYKELFDKAGLQLIPCWGLAALLDIIPKHIKDYNVLRIDISENNTAIWYDEIGYGVNNKLPDITKETAVDACVEMIIRLHELNLL